MANLFSSTRVKILAWILVPVALLVTTLIGTISYLTISENAREIDQHLAREANELQLLAQDSIDPSTGSGFSSAKALLSLYISRTIPDPHETMFIVVDGVVTNRTTDNPDVRLERDSKFLTLVNQAEQVTLGDYPTDEGNARYIVVPVKGASDSGALVAIVFSDQYSEPLIELLARFALIAFFSLVAVGLVGWVVAGRVMAPITELRKTAQQVAEDDLSRRIEISGGNSELDQLALEFNSMLDRIQEAFSSQARFVDDAGHELRTPLTIVMGHFELMETDPSQRESSMAIIKDELGRMSRLVRDLQTLTKSSSPGFIARQVVDLDQFADELRDKASVLGIEKLEISADSTAFSFDPQRLTQALLQLIENAKKHGGENVEIKVSLGANQQLSASVEDSGPGVSDADLPKLFLPFFRAKGKADLEGAGLGLALVKAIAVAHGGDVEAEQSQLGGLKITLLLREG